MIDKIKAQKEKGTQGPQAGEWHTGEPPVINNLPILGIRADRRAAPEDAEWWDD